MKELFDKMRKREEVISRRKGGFNLFALMLRDGADNQWDILVSAPWIKNDKTNALKFISSELRKGLKEAEILAISRVIAVEDFEPVMKAFHSAINVEHGSIEFERCTLFGLEIKRAFVITSTKTPSEQSNSLKKKKKKRDRKKEST